MSNEGTHVASKENARPPTPIESLRTQMEGEFVKTVANYYRGNEQEAMMFKTAAVDYVRKVPKLLECDRVSLLSAFVQAAQFRLLPSGVGGQCYVIPYGKEAKFQLGYQGIVELLYRTDKVHAVTANIVYTNDDFNYEEGLNPILYHKPVAFGKEKGEAIGVYSVAQLEGGARTFKVLDKAAVMAIKDLSKAKASADSPWNSNKDPELWMWKKTCLIQHAKLLPKTQELVQAIEKDYEGEGFNRSPLDPGGMAVGRAFHQPELPAKKKEKPSESHEAADQNDVPFDKDDAKLQDIATIE